ncbi:hypothetical protein KGY77_05880 [Candidatus Bipolaricaulota bacterium]|nr:hypothetical protein [Candidatus Bipolaricaulota bacterium]
MSRLSDREKPQDKVKDELIKKQDEDVRISATVKQSDLEWLDKAIEEYNNEFVRKTNRSEVLRILMRELRERGLDDIL